MTDEPKDSAPAAAPEPPPAAAEPPPPDAGTATPKATEPATLAPAPGVLTAPSPPALPATPPPAPAPAGPRDAIAAPIEVSTQTEEPPRKVRWYDRYANAINILVGIPIAIATLILVVWSECGRRTTEVEQRASTSRAIRVAESTLVEQRRNAETAARTAETAARAAAAEDSVRRAQVAAEEAARGANASAAEAKERRDRETVAAYDRELARRFGVLRDSLTAIGLMWAIRPDGSLTYRAGIAWETFLRPNRRSYSARELMATVAALDRGPQAEQALAHLDAIAYPDRATLYRGPENSRPEPGTMVIEYRDPNAPPGVNDRRWLPVAEVVRLLEVPRWADGREPFR